MIIVFDLDDTLYDEITYVRSSLFEVSLYLSEKLHISKDIIYSNLNEVLEINGRGKVFDIVLTNYGIYSKSEVKRCLSIYRSNNPKIKLFDHAISCLERFKYYHKYLVTDGNKVVQKKKIDALGLNKYFIKALPTHNFGIANAKPSTYVFNKILKWENASPHELVYIGDNPKKDFVNLKKEGFKTIRVLTGCYKNLRLESEFEADYLVNTLDEINNKLIKTLKTKT